MLKWVTASYKVTKRRRGDWNRKGGEGTYLKREDSVWIFLQRLT